MRIPSRFRAETQYTKSTDKKANVNPPMMAAVGNGDAATFRVTNRDNFYWIRLINDANRLTQCFSPVIALAYDDYIYVAKASDRKLTYYQFVSFIQDSGGGTSPILNARGIIIPDNVALGFYIEDDDSFGGGSPEYMRIVTTDASWAIVFNNDDVDMNFRVASSAIPIAFLITGATGAIQVDGPSLTVPDDWWWGLGPATTRMELEGTGTNRFIFHDAYLEMTGGHIWMPDNTADSMHIADMTAGFAEGIEYQRFTTTDAQPIIDFNNAQVDIDIYLRSLALDAIFIEGATATITLGGPGMIVPDDWWLGFAGAGRLVFDITPAPDQIVLTSADLNMAGNDIIIPDALADAMHVIDDTTAINFQQFITTAAAQATVFNIGEADVDFNVRASAGISDPTDAFFVEGLTGRVFMGDLAPVYVGHVNIYDATVNTTAGFYGFTSEHTKTAGVTDANDPMWGLVSIMRVNQAGGTVGQFVGARFEAELTDGSVGTLPGSPRDMIGYYQYLDLRGGLVTQDAYGGYIYAVQQAANTVTRDLYVLRLHAALAGTVTGTTYMLHLQEDGNADFGYYQTTSAGVAGANYLEGKLTLASAELEFTAASGSNLVEVPDNVADAWHLSDVGGLEYIRAVSTNANPYVLLFPAEGGDVGVGTTGPNLSASAVAVTIESTTGVPALELSYASDTIADNARIGLIRWHHASINRVAGYIDMIEDGAGETAADMRFYTSTGGVAVLYMTLDSIGRIITPTSGGGADGIYDGRNMTLSANDSNILYSGGNATNAGANLTLLGGAHATLPDMVRFRASGNVRLWMAQAGHWYPDGNKTQDLGLATNRWRDVYSGNALSSGTSRLVDVKKICPVCATQMVRSTGGLLVTGEVSDFTLVFCPSCGAVAMEEVQHRTQPTSKLPDKVILDGIEVIPMSGNSRTIQIKFRYGDDGVDIEETIQKAPHNSTFLSDLEMVAFEQMTKAERKAFLLDLGKREWDALEEMKAIEVDMESTRVQLDILAGHLIGKDLLKEAALPN